MEISKKKIWFILKMELAIQSCFPFQALLSIIFKNLCYTKILESFRVKKNSDLKLWFVLNLASFLIVNIFCLYVLQQKQTKFLGFYKKFRSFSKSSTI